MSKAARVLCYCLICWSPLPLASNRPIFWVINGVAVLIATALFIAGEWRKDPPGFSWAPIALPASCIGLVLLWMAVQTIPGMPAGIRHPAWDALSPEAAAHGTISIDPSATWTTIVEVLPIALLGIMVARMTINRSRARLVLNLVVWTTTIVAAYGLAGEALGFRQAFLVEDVAYPGAVTGTFIGRNAAATYFVLGMACASAFVSMYAEDLAAGAALQSRWILLADFVRRSGLYLAADIILAAALLNTGSRGGTIAGGIVLLVITLIGLRRAGPRRGTLAATFAAVLAAVFTAVAISSDFLFARLATGVSAGDRLAVYGDTLNMIRARPLLGHGGGAFIDAFPLYHASAPAGYLWNRTHDTYLQAAAELGIPAFLVLILAFILVMTPIARSALAGDSARPAAVAAVAAAAAVAFHSIVDFSLQVQAVGLTAAVVVAAGLGEALLRRQATPVISVPEEGVLPIIVRETISVAIPTGRG